MNVRKVLEKTAGKYGAKNALVFNGQSVTFAELRDCSLRLAAVLKKMGVKKGDKVGIYLPNCVEYVYSYLACFCLGAVGVPLDFMLRNDELISCLSHSESKILIAKSNKGVNLQSILNSIMTLENILSCDDDLIGLKKLNEELTMVEPLDHIEVINDSDPSLIMYTSGTTGKPKGILLNYKHLEGSAVSMEYFVDLTEKDIKLVAIPFSHIGGFVYIQNCIMFGITLILMERFNPFEFLELIARYKVTCFHIVPAMYNAILSLKQIEKFDLSSLRWVVVFGAPSSPEIMERFHKHCPNARLLNGWGMTETCPPNTVTPMDSDNIASVGKPAPHCEIKIFDEMGSELPVGKVGEIVIRGWVVMDEYYKDQEATEQVKRNGWLYTGDLGRFDEEGFLYIVGRKKEMIKVAGQIVYAPEVEAAFYKHEDVSEVAAIGVTDPLRGETIKAYIVLKDGSRLSAEDLRYFAKEHLAHFKVPQAIELCDGLPKNRAGKIDKELLKQKN